MQITIKETTDEERATLIRYVDESWIAAYRKFLIMRYPLVFRLLFGPRLGYIDGDESRVLHKRGICTAICSQVMRGGKHFVTFQVEEGSKGFVCLGIIRPINNWNGDRLGDFNPFESRQFAALRENDNGRWGNSDVNICMYRYVAGKCWSCSWEVNSGLADGDSTWNNARLFEGSVLGMLLDLDEGTLAIYQNNQKLGVMKSGLTGEYCWGICLLFGASTASIARGRVPTD